MTTFNNDSNILIEKKLKINEDGLYYHSEEGRKTKNLKPINNQIIIQN